MATPKRSGLTKRADRKFQDSIDILKALGFGPRQTNRTAGYVLLALLDLLPSQPWSAAHNPLCGITPIIEFIRNSYRVGYAPNTRETVRDEAVKHFVEAGLVLRNPDQPDRPTNSGKTVYQIESTALALLKSFGTKA
jgi:BsuBI/PstI restriction endonuclease HTH domain